MRKWEVEVLLIRDFWEAKVRVIGIDSVLLLGYCYSFVTVRTHRPSKAGWKRCCKFIDSRQQDQPLHCYRFHHLVPSLPRLFFVDLLLFVSP